MSDILQEKQYSVLSLFSGAGGLDIGFEQAGFVHTELIDIDENSVRTLSRNRPHWNNQVYDVREYSPHGLHPDVLLAGFPCQGISLGGRRDRNDERNTLYREVVRLARQMRPRIVIIENVLNLRTMPAPGGGASLAHAIGREMSEAGYAVQTGVFRMSEHGVPQTRRRYIYACFRGDSPLGYHLPQPNGHTSVREWIFDLAHSQKQLPNHAPHWGFQSSVHIETGQPVSLSEELTPVRLSRTASDGNPIRSWDSPIPAIDTATIWGFAQGNVTASRKAVDRTTKKFVRNPLAEVKLWRIEAARIRSFTHREYARLQTFPDDWEFVGDSKRSVHLQIGNAVPVHFAHMLAENIRLALIALDSNTPFPSQTERQMVLRL